MKYLILLLLSSLCFCEDIELQDKPTQLVTGILNITNDPRNFWGAINTGMPVLAVFTTKTCPSCVQAKAIIKDWAARNLDVIIIVIDAEDSIDISWRHKIQQVPTIFWYENKKLLGRSSGLGPTGLDKWANDMKLIAGEK